MAGVPLFGGCLRGSTAARGWRQVKCQWERSRGKVGGNMVGFGSMRMVCGPFFWVETYPFLGIFLISEG